MQVTEPCFFRVKKHNSKYEGSAGQLRVLSKIMTILLSEVLDKSKVGSMVVKLQEVAEFVVAPHLTLYEIDYHLTEVIQLYLDLRKRSIQDIGMPPARPKHHFLSHYPLLFKRYGPLINLWTMRMESKHSFFKNVVRSSKNFKNVSLGC